MFRGICKDVSSVKAAFLHPKAVVQKWYVSEAHAGLRADLYLKEWVKRLSRTHAGDLIQKGDFRLASGPLKPSRRLKAGQAVELWRLPPDDPANLKPHAVKIIYENEFILVLNKPAGLALHPSARYLYETVTHWLRQYSPDLRIYPVHRLDRETSGLLLCAKTKAAKSALQSAFQKGSIAKTYLALVVGHLKEPLDIVCPLSIQGDRGLVRIKMIEDHQTGLWSRTLVTPLSYHQEHNQTLVRCEPKTGRQHQIRAHLSIKGYPIVGDKLYAFGEEYFDGYTKGLVPTNSQDRHMLHAESLKLELFGENYTFYCPFDLDLCYSP